MQSPLTASELQKQFANASDRIASHVVFGARAHIVCTFFVYSAIAPFANRKWKLVYEGGRDSRHRHTRQTTSFEKRHFWIFDRVWRSLLAWLGMHACTWAFVCECVCVLNESALLWIFKGALIFKCQKRVRCQAGQSVQRHPAVLQEPMTCNTVLAVMFCEHRYHLVRDKISTASFFLRLFAQCAPASSIPTRRAHTIACNRCGLSMQQRRDGRHTRNIHENPVRFHFRRVQIVVCSVLSVHGRLWRQRVFIPPDLFRPTTMSAGLTLTNFRLSSSVYSIRLLTGNWKKLRRRDRQSGQRSSNHIK